VLITDGWMNIHMVLSKEIPWAAAFYVDQYGGEFAVTFCPQPEPLTKPPIQ
jgi:hypothetical protein